MTRKNTHHRHCPPCFAEGTMLLVGQADCFAMLVEDIRIGDKLMTKTGIREVKWVGRDDTNETLYLIYNKKFGVFTQVTGNHGIAVRLMDGSRALCAAKFLTDAEYGDMLVVKDQSTKPVYHIMFDKHELLYTVYGLVSESYFVGGYETHHAAQIAYTKSTGREEMDLTLPRLKRKDVGEIIEFLEM